MIFLIGYMGSGKTTFGSYLSLKTGKKYVDLDDYIEQKAGKKIYEIFKEKGEEEFRNLERESLHEVINEGFDIIACGGGTPCRIENLNIMKKNGKVIWLIAEPVKIWERLKIAREERPLLNNLDDEGLWEKINSDLETRGKYYGEADILWDSSKLDTMVEIEENIKNFVTVYSELEFAITK